MKTIKQIIPRVTQEIRKRAYRDYTMELITQKQLDKILDGIKTLKKVVEEINENKVLN